MKKVVAKGFVKAALLVMAIIVAGVSAQAQTLQYRLTVNIPFDFTVTGKKLPAGTYWVKRAHDTSGDTVLQIATTDGRSTVNRFSIPIFTFNPSIQRIEQSWFFTATTTSIFSPRFGRPVAAQDEHFPRRAPNRNSRRKQMTMWSVQ